MSWTLAPAVASLRTEVNTRYPNRSKVSDGTIGDAAHSARTSDHNPDGDRMVCAFDMTKDGNNCREVIDILIARRDPRIKYIIFEGKILSGNGGPSPWVWRPYHGSNGHYKHAHFSITQAGKRNAGPWGVADHAPIVRPPAPAPAAPAASPDIRWIQERLHYWGFDAGTVDGINGPKTKAAIVAFQRAKRIGADGIVGPVTRGKLAENKPAPRPAPSSTLLRRGSKGPAVRRLQERLKTGYPAYRHSSGNMVVDGDYGPTTERWVRRFQSLSGLTVDGIAGPATLSRLGL